MARKTKAAPPPPPRFIIRGGEYGGEACTIVKRDQARGLVTVNLDRYPGWHLMMGADRLSPA